MLVQSTSASLDDQIRSIQNEVARAKSVLTEATAVEKKAEKRRNDTLQTISMDEECQSLRPEAESSKKLYNSLLGVHSFSATTISETCWRFVSNIQSGREESHLVYSIEGNDSISATVSSRGGDTSKNFAPRRNKSISAYIASCVDLQVTKVHRSKLLARSSIPEHMQAYFWKIGRLDVSARELQAVLKRFKARLNVSTNQGCTMTVDFEKEETKLEVKFSVSLEYPTLPLEVDLHLLRGELDLDKIRIMLQKNVKPGFGNFLRTCDMINAYCGLRKVIR